MKWSLRITATSLALFICAMAQPVLAAEWSDFALGYRYGQEFREPGIDKDVTKNIASFTMANGYQTGGNFMNLDVLFSNESDPANGGDMGATELYLTYVQDFAYGKIVNGKPLNYGILKDVSFSVGSDLSAKNTTFAANKAAFYAGPTLNLTIPTPTPGFVDVSVRGYKEWGHNGISAMQVNFDPTYMFAVDWSVPFNVASLPMKFRGFANYIGKKGTDGFDEETKPETLMDAFLMADIGALVGKANFAYVGVGLEYWNNKYGTPNKPGINEPTVCPMIACELHPF